ncbi:Complex I intermediate-associated protein 30 (CIA30) [Tenacibaculum sp. MAR_2009_124]|uniref:CIA30 family protein n=1 Tax=Tenacibaculum sp. MAR_2009_124 TaxID=1250059 RepID=UPI00089750E3|nr:CIA30 family protein [Tenacibaculum sp. MAR_2009_124]SEB44242.1 Complex I intermediate-associated protein 30 (CIA30) [Tenacibaculum sp. MAR_2009_124]
MKLLTIIAALFMTISEIVICDFSKNNFYNWKVINDDVMGGISTSSMKVNSNGQGVFSGEVSTENNGGFAMTRLKTAVEISNKNKRIVLHVKGDGKEYQFRIKSQAGARYWYVQSFKTTTEEQKIELNLKDFYPSFRGYKLNKENFNSDKIEEIAILIGNKKNENFQLKITKILIE